RRSLFATGHGDLLAQLRAATESNTLTLLLRSSCSSRRFAHPESFPARFANSDWELAAVIKHAVQVAGNPHRCAHIRWLQPSRHRYASGQSNNYREQGPGV